MHGLWNGSSLLSIEAYFLVYLFWMVPIFGLAIGLGVASRRREQRIVAEKLPGMVAAGLVTPNEATWLGSIRNRKLAIDEATRLGGKAAGKGVKNFAAQVVELAFVRDRIDRGFGDERVLRAAEGGGGRRRGVARHHADAADTRRVPRAPSAQPLSQLRP